MRTTAAFLLVVGGLIMGTALAQPAPNPTQTPAATPQADTPVFRVVVVGRSIKAINFRPRGGETKFDFCRHGPFAARARRRDDRR